MLFTKDSVAIIWGMQPRAVQVCVQVNVVHLNFARYTGYSCSYMPSSPLGVYKPLVAVALHMLTC